MPHCDSVFVPFVRLLWIAQRIIYFYFIFLFETIWRPMNMRTFNRWRNSNFYFRLSAWLLIRLCDDRWLETLTKCETIAMLLSFGTMGLCMLLVCFFVNLSVNEKREYATLWAAEYKFVGINTSSTEQLESIGCRNCSHCGQILQSICWMAKGRKWPSTSIRMCAFEVMISNKISATFAFKQKPLLIGTLNVWNDLPRQWINKQHKWERWCCWMWRDIQWPPAVTNIRCTQHKCMATAKPGNSTFSTKDKRFVFSSNRLSLWRIVVRLSTFEERKIK